MAGRHMGWLGIASIFSCIAIVLDGPLLQRASIVTTASPQGPSVELQFSMVPEIPTGKLHLFCQFLELFRLMKSLVMLDLEEALY